MIFCALGFSLPLKAVAADDALPVLRTAREVRGLSAGEANRARKAQLTGVVLGLAEPPGRAAIIWDETDGIYVVAPNQIMGDLASGDCVLVEGVTQAGGYAPLISVDRLEKRGRMALPAPRRVFADDLFSKGLDAQWIVVTGVVREMRSVRGDEVLPDRNHPAGAAGPFEHRLKLTLAMGDRLVAVLVYGRLSPEDYVDAEVEITGICVNQHNARRQFFNPLIMVPQGVSMRVVKPPPSGGAFSGEPVSSGALFQFRPDGISAHRVHLMGVVLHQRLGSGIWIRNEGQGLFVETDQQAPLEPGDLVSVAGFAQRSGFSPNLANGQYRKSGRGEAPKPSLLKARGEVAGHDGDLVLVEGRLLEQKEDEQGRRLRLAWQGLELTVQCSPAALPGDYETFESGSILSVAGICVVGTSREGPLSGFIFPDRCSIIVRGPADISLKKAAPWWSGRRLIMVLAALSATLAAVLLSVSIVSRQKIRREKELRKLEIAQYSARLAERSRMARDIHDTVAQGLGAISLQLELAAANGSGEQEKLMGHLSMAHKLVRTSMTEVRSYIRQLRRQNQQDVDLASALEEMLRTLVEGTNIVPEFSLQGEVLSLSPAQEAQVLRIVQESILNAVRHSGAGKIALAVTHADEALVVELRDDGHGFDPTTNYAASGHFGVTGMRERAALLGAELLIDSAAGRGTCVRLSIPRTGMVSFEENL